MPSYSIRCDMRRHKWNSCNRVYKSEASAKAAVMKMFRARMADGSPMDEIWLYEGNLDSWSSPEPRYIGKAAYQGDGATPGWFAST